VVSAAGTSAVVRLAPDILRAAGLERVLDGGYPDREPMLAIAGWAVERALAVAGANR
jgi:hypothetical protein